MDNQIDLNPARPALHARELDALLALYLEDVALRKNERTARDYTYALSLFRDWWQANGPRLHYRLTESDLLRYGRELESMTASRTGRLFSYHTCAAALSRLKQAFKWAHRNNYLARDIAHWVPTPDGEPRERQALPVEHLAHLLDVARRSRYPLRDGAILAVLIGTGIRRAECAAIQIEDVTIHATGEGEILIRRGKGGRARTVLFGTRTGAYLDAHLAALDRTEGPLWISRNKGPLTKKGIYQVVKTLVGRAGLEQYINGPHDLRRLFATVWNRNRKGLHAAVPLSKQLGHKSAEMTLRYILPDLDDIRREYISPLDVVADKLPEWT